MVLVVSSHPDETLDASVASLEQRVSELSCPSSTDNGSVADAFGSGGDYFGMVTGPDGRFRLLWSDARDGPFQLWTAWVEVEGEVGESN